MTEPKVTAEQAFEILRQNPKYQSLIQDAYLDGDVSAAAARFESCAEFGAVKDLLGTKLDQAILLDLGAGNGIVSYAFARAGASKVIAVEPDPSDSVGQGAIRTLCEGLNVEIIDSYGECIDMPDESVDIVYARQVLHHTQDLQAVMHECHRILKPGGIFLACREHVVDNDQQMIVFLANHPVHQLAGNEGAYSLIQYTSAIDKAGFVNRRVLYTYDTVINAFPSVRSSQELDMLPQTLLSAKLGRLGNLLGRLQPVKSAVTAFKNRSSAGRLISLIAFKTQR